jgi:hypothetical protein
VLHEKETNRDASGSQWSHPPCWCGTRLMGDDVGWAHVFDNAETRQGSGRRHALHRLLRGATCTAGPANFITAEPPIRTYLTTVSQTGAKSASPDQAPTIAIALKALG